MAGVWAVRGVCVVSGWLEVENALGRVVVAAEPAKGGSEEVRSCVHGCVGSDLVSVELGDGAMRCSRR